MAKKINITIENRLIKEKRDMNVYHNATRSAHMIGYDSSITLPFKPALENDYLYISIVSGPGNLECKSVINLPSWVNFQFLSEVKLAVTHSDDRTFLIIHPGLPGWELKLTRPDSSDRRGDDRVIISEDPED